MTVVPVVDSDWAFRGNPGSLCCMACGESYAELTPPQSAEGLVYDLVFFLSLCKRCVILIVQNGARKWPDEVAAAMVKGAVWNGEDRAGE